MRSQITHTHTHLWSTRLHTDLCKHTFTTRIFNKCVCAIYSFLRKATDEKKKHNARAAYGSIMYSDTCAHICPHLCVAVWSGRHNNMILRAWRASICESTHTHKHMQVAVREFHCSARCALAFCAASVRFGSSSFDECAHLQFVEVFRSVRHNFVCARSRREISGRCCRGSCGSLPHILPNTNTVPS